MPVWISIIPPFWFVNMLIASKGGRVGRKTTEKGERGWGC
jgi:hypothetical protein